MVLADFLNRTLLEPQKQRDRERLKKARAEAHETGHAEGRAEGHAEGRAEGHAEGRAEAMDIVRVLMREKGLDPDEIIPPANGD